MSKDIDFANKARKAHLAVVAYVKVLSESDDKEELERTWGAFLAEYHKVCKFCISAASHSDRIKWAVAFKAERKENETLNYLFHARNSDEHVEFCVSEGAGGALKIGNLFSFGGNCENVTIKNCVSVTRLPNGQSIEQRIDGNFSSRNGFMTEGSIETSLPVDREPARLKLNDVIDRGVTYQVPTKFKGDKRQFVLVAAFARDWLSKKIRELL